MAVFVLAACASALQVLASRALSVSLFDAWLALLASASAAQAGFGLGAAAALRWPAVTTRRWLLGWGLSCWAFSAAGLSLRPGALPPARVAAAVACVLLVFACAGAAYARVFSAARERRGASRAVAVSLAGAALGLWAGGRLASGPGVHAAVGALGLAFAAAGLGLRPVWAAVLACAAASWPGLDTRLERARGAALDCNWRCDSRRVRESFTRIASRWTPYSRLDVYRHAGTRELQGAYNYRVHWRVTKAEMRPWAAFVRPQDRVLIAGSSAGYDYRLLPPGTPLENVDFVEIDPGVAELFTSSPALNGGLYEGGRLVVADARHVLDRGGRRWGALIMGSAESPSRGIGRLLETRNSLLTREAVARALDRAVDDGVVMYFPRDDAGARAVAASFEELGRPWFAYYQDYRALARAPNAAFRQYNLFAARDRATLERAWRAVRAADADLRRDGGRGGRDVLLDRAAALKTLWPSGLDAAPRDAAPFLAGQDPVVRPWLRPIAAAAWLAVLLLAAACVLRPGVPSYFGAIGASYALALTALAAAWACALGDPLRTALAVTASWTAGAMLGARAIESRGPLSARAAWGAAAGLAAALAVAAAAAPRGWNPAAAFLLAVAVVTPAGAIAGLFFPSALERLAPAQTARALAWDAAGAALSLPLFAALALDPRGGFPSCLAAAAVLYAAAAAGGRRLHQ